MLGFLGYAHTGPKAVGWQAAIKHHELFIRWIPDLVGDDTFDYSRELLLFFILF